MAELFMLRLRYALQDKGISRSELSRLSGISKGDITHYLKGDYVPKQDKCYLLAKALDVDPGWLMLGTGSKTGKERTEIDDDLDRLEALHQNPQLGLLFDRTRHMSKEDVDFMIKLADRITKERDGE